MVLYINPYQYYWYRYSGPSYFWPILLVPFSNGLNWLAEWKQANQSESSRILKPTFAELNQWNGLHLRRVINEIMKGWIRSHVCKLYKSSEWMPLDWKYHNSWSYVICPGLYNGGSFLSKQCECFHTRESEWINTDDVYHCLGCLPR